MGGGSKLGAYLEALEPNQADHILCVSFVRVLQELLALLLTGARPSAQRNARALLVRRIKRQARLVVGLLVLIAGVDSVGYILAVTQVVSVGTALPWADARRLNPLL